MSGYPIRTMFAWIALLALIWLALFSPWPAGWNWACAVVVIASLLVGVVVASKRIRERKLATQHVLNAIDSALTSLPEGIKRHTPLVLTIGETDSALVRAFGNDLVHITDAAIWVRADDPARLMHLADALKRWRNGQGPDAVAWLVSADAIVGAVSLQATLKRWRSAIVEANRAIDYRLPVLLALYAEEPDATPDDCPWFGVSGDEPLSPQTLPALVAERLAIYSRMSIPDDRKPRAFRAARLDALARWSSDAVLAPLIDPQRGVQSMAVVAFGVTAVEGQAAPDSLFGRFVTSVTALRPAFTSNERAGFPLPEPLIRGIAPQPVRRALPRACAHAFAWLAVAFCAAAGASAWHNRALVTRVVADMTRYREIPAAQDAARVDALEAIKRDRDELERYASAGVPPRLGVGLYRGAPFISPLNRLIESYQPPAPPPATVELDSMSLFDSGQSKLKAGSNRALVGALQMIEANPDKRVLIAGHTDSVGDTDFNLKLSGARAAAVRDWLADASGISPTHFAIQSYGDTRPKASNDTEAGRAANRRVEITLVPDCRDERGSGSTLGHPACI